MQIGMKKVPSMDEWLREAKKAENAEKIGMYLVHNGVVRRTAKAKVRQNRTDTADVAGMYFSYDEEKVAEAVKEVYEMEGIYYIRTWLNSGELEVGDDLMYVLVGGDIRPHVIAALETLVEKIKTGCVVETEVYA